MKIYVVPLASSLHGEKYVRLMMGSYRSVLLGFEGLVFHGEPVDEPFRDVPLDTDLLVLIHLTGGTSSLAYRTAIALSDKGLLVPILLLAHSKHNSLASALSARIKLLKSGFKTYLIYSDDKNDLMRRFTAFYQGVRAGYELGRMKILDINADGRLSLKAKLFIEKTGSRVDPISFEELAGIGEEASRSEVEALIDHVSDYMDLSSVRSGELEKIMRIYYAMRKLVADKGYTGIVIDCFPLIVKYHVTPCIPVALMNSDGIPTACEGDYHSLIMMYLSLALTGRPGWISNPSGITRDGYLRFAHCTIAPTLGRDCWATTHFETGHHYAVACRYRYRRVLFGRVNESMDSMIIYRGVVRDSGLLEPGYCRTQLIIDTGPLRGEEFIEEAWGNHHVFMPWREDLPEMLKAYGWWMGWSLTIRN